MMEMVEVGRVWHVDDGQWPSPDKEGNEDESQHVKSPYNTV